MIFEISPRCSRIYGGFVIPKRRRHPFGITSTNCHNNSGKEDPISLP